MENSKRVYNFALFIDVKRLMKMEESRRFGKMSSAEIERLLDNATTKSTVKSTKFGKRIFDGRHQ